MSIAYVYTIKMKTGQIQVKTLSQSWALYKRLNRSRVGWSLTSLFSTNIIIEELSRTTGEQTEMPLGLWAAVGSRNYVSE